MCDFPASGRGFNLSGQSCNKKKRLRPDRSLFHMNPAVCLGPDYRAITKRCVVMLLPLIARMT